MSRAANGGADIEPASIGGHADDAGQAGQAEHKQARVLKCDCDGDSVGNVCDRDFRVDRRKRANCAVADEKTMR